MMNLSIGADGRVYLTAMVQNPNSHFPAPQTVCINDLVEQSVRKVMAEMTSHSDKRATTRA